MSFAPGFSTDESGMAATPMMRSPWETASSMSFTDASRCTARGTDQSREDDHLAQGENGKLLGDGEVVHVSAHSMGAADADILAGWMLLVVVNFVFLIWHGELF